jgi:hypothetical protein
MWKLIQERLSKLKNFDFRWLSLITSKPILFEDLDYLNIRSFITDTITNEEIAAYKRHELRAIYPSIDSLLLLNLKYYERIMSYCTLFIHGYVRIDGDIEKFKVPLNFDLTPTKIWCAIMTSPQSTPFEIEYAWKMPLNNLSSQVNYQKLMTNPSFKMYNQIRSFVNNYCGFSEQLIIDHTSNIKLTQVCSKFLKVLGISIDNTSFMDDILSIDSHQKKIYDKYYELLEEMFPSTSFALFVFTNEIIIHTPKFGLKIINNNGSIEKQYTSNSYECIVAEQELSKICNELIDWIRLKPKPSNSLISILTNLLNKEYRNVVCFHLHGNNKTIIKFTGIFNNVYIIENLYVDNHLIMTNKRCLSKEKAAQYIVERGYYVFTTDNQYHPLQELEKLYLPHTVSVIETMTDIVAVCEINIMEVRDITLNGYVSSEKISNDIVITNLKDVPDMTYLASKNTGKGYWEVIS